MGDDIVELSTKNDALKDKIGSYDQQWLDESKTQILKQIDDDKIANLTMSVKKKQMEKTLNKWLTYLIINYERVSLTTWFLKEINYKI